MIIERFELQVKKYPHKTAVKTESGYLTYHELDVVSNRIANEIKKVSRDRANIGVLFNDGLKMITAIFGILKSGNTYVPLVKDFPAKRLQLIIDHAEIDIFITGKQDRDAVAKAVENRDLCFIIMEERSVTAAKPTPSALQPPLRGRRFLDSTPGCLPAHSPLGRGAPKGRGGLESSHENKISTNNSIFQRETCSDSIAYILYTSGSTGFPKGVMQTHRNILYFVDRYIENLRIHAGDNVTHFPVFSHDASVMDIYPALLSGATLFPLDLKEDDRFSSLADWLNNEKISIYHSVPTVFRYFMTGLKDRPLFPCLRYIVLGGEAVFKNDVVRFSSLFSGCSLYNLYGQTESTYNSGRFFNAGEPAAKITLGEVNKGMQVFVIDDEGNEAEPLEVGEIVISGKHLSPGYFNNEEETGKKFVKGENGEMMYCTGDLGRLLMNGEIEYVDRKDNQVKIRGFRVELGEIENVVLPYPYITTAAAVPIETASREIFIACYFSAGKDIEIESLREFLRDRLPDYMIPSYFKQLEKLPVTVSGKIDRKALPVPEVTIGEEYVPPVTKIEKKLVETWSEILDIGPEVIGLKGNFFDLGGHSLSATLLTAAIYKVFRVKVPLQEVFNRPTIESLSSYIEQFTEQAESSEYEMPLPVEKREYYSLSSAQRRLFMLQQLDRGGTGYNMLNLFDIGEHADRGRLENACKRLVQRHEILRTSFFLIDREPVQRVHADFDFDLDYFEPGKPESRDPGALAELVENYVKPFNLSKAPLFRAALIKAGDRYSFMVDFHHIIADNVSLNLLEYDFLGLYDGSLLPELNLHYKDYFLWQHTGLSGTGLKDMEEYWMETLAGELPVLDLPTDYPRPALRSFAGKTIGIILEEDETKGAKTLARETGSTLYIVLLTVLNILMSKLCRCEDMIIGVPAAGRVHPYARKLIGMLVNTIVVRNFPYGGKRFPEFLQEVKRSLIAANENQEYPFEELVEKVGVRRDVSRNPLFDVIFNLIDERAYKGDVTEANEQHDVIYLRDTSRFDLNLTVIDRGSKLIFRFEYCTALFKENTIRRIMQYFRRILGVLLVNREKKLANIDILDTAEKEKLLYECNDTGMDFPRDRTIHRLFRDEVSKKPDRIALAGGEQPGCFTYCKLNEESDRLAQRLTTAGAEPGAVIALLVERSPAMIIAIFGILKAGGAYLPIEIGSPGERISYMLADSKAAVLVTTGTLSREVKNLKVSKLRNLHIETILIEETGNRQEAIGSKKTQENRPVGDAYMHPETGRRGEPCVPPPMDTGSGVGAGDLAYIIYTSGTTGKPKGVLTRHYNVTRVVRNTNYIEIKPEDRLLQLSNYAFDGSVFDIYGALVNGAALVLAGREKVLPIHLLSALIKREQVTVFFVTTALFNTLVDLEIECFAGIRKVLFGGERVSVEHAGKALEYMGKDRIVHVYGPTETTVYATYYPIDRIERPATADTIPIGLPIANTTVYIMDKYLRPVPVGVNGEIYIGGAGTARGYLNNPELTAEKFIASGPTAWGGVEGPSGHHVAGDKAEGKIYKTGDLARRLPCSPPAGGADKATSGGIIEFIGRIDNQVKIRGYRIEMGEIENRLLTYVKVKEAVVTVRENNRDEKQVCAYVVTGEELDTTGLREWLSLKLPYYMMPSFFVQLEKIPLTANGKVDYKALPEPGIGRAEAGYIPPRNEIDGKLASVWQEVLGVEKIGITDNFFEIGGDSIKAIQVIARLKKHRLELNINDLFLYPSIEHLGKYVKEPQNRQKNEQGIISGQVPLTPIQEWFLSNNFNQDFHFNHAVMIYRETGFAEDLTRKLFTKIVTHHDALRIVYRRSDSDEVSQWNNPLEEPLFDLSVMDLRDTPVGETEGEIEKAANRLQRSIDLEKGPLLKLGLFKTTRGDHLLIVIHHLVVDGVSWRILLEDAANGYSLLEQGKEIHLPEKTASFRYWSRKQVEYSSGESLLNELEYWHAVEKTEFSKIPKDFKDGGSSKRSSSEVAAVDFSEEETRALLREVNHAYNTEINDILLTALGMAVKEWKDLDKVVINLEGHGRENIIEGIDITRTIGWFTTQFPVVLEMGQAANLSYTIKSVKETIRKIPEKGIGYGILKYLTPAVKRKGITFCLEPEISFNYLGQFDLGVGRSSFDLSPVKVGDSISPLMERFRPIDITGIIRGERLTITFSFSKHEFMKRTIEKLAACYRTNLIAVIRHCAGKEEKELTPADMDYSKEITIDQLEELEDRFSGLDLG